MKLPSNEEMIIDELKDLHKQALKLSGKDREDTIAAIKFALKQVFDTVLLSKRDVSELQDMIEEAKIILAKLLK